MSPLCKRDRTPIKLSLNHNRERIGKEAGKGYLLEAQFHTTSPTLLESSGSGILYSSCSDEAISGLPSLINLRERVICPCVPGASMAPRRDLGRDVRATRRPHKGRPSPCGIPSFTFPMSSVKSVSVCPGGGGGTDPASLRRAGFLEVTSPIFFTGDSFACPFLFLPMVEFPI